MKPNGKPSHRVIDGRNVLANAKQGKTPLTPLQTSHKLAEAFTKAASPANVRVARQRVSMAAHALLEGKPADRITQTLGLPHPISPLEQRARAALNTERAAAQVPPRGRLYALEHGAARLARITGLPAEQFTALRGQLSYVGWQSAECGAGGPNAVFEYKAAGCAPIRFVVTARRPRMMGAVESFELQVNVITFDTNDLRRTLSPEVNFIEDLGKVLTVPHCGGQGRPAELAYVERSYRRTPGAGERLLMALNEFLGQDEEGDED